ncbi:MAG: type II secretion system F family protein [Elusimicrobiota bacterium]
MFNIIKILILAVLFFGIVQLVLFLNSYFDKVKEEAKKESEEREKGKTPTDWVLDKLREEPRSTISRLIKVGAGGVVALITFIVLGRLYWTVVFGIGGTFIPGMVSNYLYKKYMDKFDQQFIDGLSLITNALTSGSSFPQALELMVTESKEPLSEIFGETLREFKLGVSMSEALENTTERVESEQLRMTVTAINISRETGGNLGEILSRIADTMRARQKLKGKVDALTSQGRLSGLVVAACPFLLMIVLNMLDPELMEPLFNTIVGNVLITVVIIMVAMGWFVISKIINIEV